MTWANRYVGIAYADISEPAENGLDCWQLVRVVLREQFEIEIPSLRYPVSTDYEKFYEHFLADYASFSQCFYKVVVPCEGDLVLICKNKIPAHVGIMVNGSHFLHTTPSTGAVIEKLNEHWKDRLDGIYRHQSKRAADP